MYFITLADVNNDGHLDIIVVDTYGENIGIYIGLGHGIFRNRENLRISFNSHSLAIDDFNKDGKLDMVMATKDGESVNTYLGDGFGGFKFEESNKIKFERFSPFITTGDFNNDKNLDVAIAGLDSANMVTFLGNGKGKFSNGTFNQITFYPHPHLTLIFVPQNLK